MNNTRIYIKEGTFPEYVKIKSKKLNLDETIEFTSFSQFINEYKHYLALAKSPFYDRVQFYFTPSVCILIWFDGESMISTCGLIDIKGVEDILFHKLEDEKYYEPILEDLFIKHLKSDNNYILQALIDSSYTDNAQNNRKYDCNFDMANAGDKLLKFVLNDYLFELYNESMVELTYRENFYLTDKQLIEIIAKKYNLLDYIKCSDEVRKNASYSYTENNIFIVKAVKAVLYAIFLKTRNYNEIMHIVRDFILNTDTSYKNMDKIDEKYKKLGQYLKSKDKYDVEEFITFEEAEKAIEDTLDYQFFRFTNFFHDYGYYITKVDFQNKLLYLDICYL